MRPEFAAALVELARRDERVMLLTADLGFSVLEPFVEAFPDRYVNVGVAEQDLIGIATGLAREGYVPFAYSIATFASMRPYEFIRNGPALHRLPVRIVGTGGGGVDYGHGGVTHFALEDVALMRVQPQICVVVPADARQAAAAIEATSEHPGPIYFRIARSGAPIAGLSGHFALGELELIGDDRAEVVIFASGPIAASAVEAADEMRGRGLRVAVGVISSFTPFPSDAVAALLSVARVAVSVEAHYRTGGLGSAVAEVIADRGLAVPLERAGIEEMPIGFSGSPDYLLHRFGLDAAGIVARASALLDRDSAPVRA
jgi:transketolase